FNRMFLDITALKDYMDISNIQKLSMNIEMEKVILLLDNSLMADKAYLSRLISMGIYNFANNKESLMYLYNHPNTYKDVAHIHQLSGPIGVPGVIPTKPEEGSTYRTAKVIGFKNATAGAGATTLIYMLKKRISANSYAVAIEVNKNDFGFFNEPDMYSVNQNNLDAALNKFGTASVILVDLNNSSGGQCDQIIYLMEPSTIKLNKMMLVNKDIFNKIGGRKLVLNKSLLSERDVRDFEFESHATISFNIPPLNEREENKDILDGFIKELGL
ncbi:MAG: hypothetical protein IKI04_01020, partial [Bacilli bacterium]|nr:hypothetical protein [Bacilli bacterium]